jgi:hypothetical protein
LPDRILARFGWLAAMVVVLAAPYFIRQWTSEPEPDAASSMWRLMVKVYCCSDCWVDGANAGEIITWARGLADHPVTPSDEAAALKELVEDLGEVPSEDRNGALCQDHAEIAADYAALQATGTWAYEDAEGNVHDGCLDMLSRSTGCEDLIGCRPSP